MPELSMQEERPTDGELLEVLADHFDVEASEVLRWLGTFNADRALTEYLTAIGIAR